MSAFKFQVGHPKEVELAFDEPRSGVSEHGAWYLYGIKTDINDENDSFFATPTLHSMIQTFKAKKGTKLTIEKCFEGDIPFYKVNGLSINDMNNSGSADKIKEALPEPTELQKLRLENSELKKEIESLKSTKLSANDIPF
tara:strand:- start:2170 stop:2589 length:420 start_codon:yes stop_codon:yes gene_type:complete